MSHAPPSAARSVPTTTQLLAVGLCGFCPFLALYVTQPLLPALMSVFGASHSRVSLTISATTLAVALTAPLIGLFADAIGRKRMIVTCTLLLAAPMLLASQAGSLDALIRWRFLQGLLIPGIFSVAIAYIAEEFSASDTAKVMSAYVAGNVFGSVLGRVIAGVVTHHAGWPAAFQVLSLLLLAGAAGIALGLKPGSRRPQRSAWRHAGRDIGVLLRCPLIASSCLVAFNQSFVFVTAFTYITFHLVAAPFRLGLVTLSYVFLVNLFGAIATPLIGPHVDRHGYRWGLWLASGAGMTGAALTAGAALPVVLIGLTLISTAVFIGQSAASSQLSRAAGPRKALAASLYVCSYYVGASAGAILPASLYIRHGWYACIGIICLLFAFNALISQRFWPARASSS